MMGMACVFALLNLWGLLPKGILLFLKLIWCWIPNTLFGRFGIWISPLKKRFTLSVCLTVEWIHIFRWYLDQLIQSHGHPLLLKNFKKSISSKEKLIKIRNLHYLLKLFLKYFHISKKKKYNHTYIL